MQFLRQTSPTRAPGLSSRTSPTLSLWPRRLSGKAVRSGYQTAVSEPPARAVKPTVAHLAASRSLSQRPSQEAQLAQITSTSSAAGLGPGPQPPQPKAATSALLSPPLQARLRPLLVQRLPLPFLFLLRTKAHQPWKAWSSTTRPPAMVRSRRPCCCRAGL